MTPEEVRDLIEAAPIPCDGVPPYERDLPKGDGYNMAAESLAHGLLILCEEDPTLLEVPSREEDPSGFKAADNDKLYNALKERWPDSFDWLGGFTLFQWGWAHNAVRYVLGVDAVGNPAEITVSVKSES